MTPPRIRLNLSLRIILLSIALVALIVGALSFLSARTIADTVRRQYADKGRMAALFLDGVIASSYGTLSDPAQLQEIVDTLMEEEGRPFYRISLYYPRGDAWSVLVSSERRLLGQPVEPGLLLPMTTNRTHDFESTLDGTPVLVVLAPVHATGAPVAVLEVDVDLKARDQLLAAQTLQGVAVAAGGVSLLVLLLYGALQWLVLRPVRALTRASRRLATGDYAMPRVVQRQDEVGELAQAFSEMATALQQREARLIEEATLRQDALRLEATRLTALGEVGRAVNAMQEVESIFRLLVERARDLVVFERFSIALREADGASWSIAYAHGMEDVLPRRPYGIEQGLPGWAIRHGEPALVHDLAADERADTEGERELVARGLRSAVIVPLRVAGETVGTLNVVGAGVGAYGPADLSLLTLLAQQVETALQNARLLERERRRAEQQRTIAEIGRQVASILDVPTLLARVGRIIQENLGFYRVNLGIVEGEHLVFGARLGPHGESLAPIRLKVGQEGITGWVAGSGQPLLVNDVTQEPRYVAAPPPEAGQTLSELAVPILLRGEVIGVLDVQSTERGAFQQEDVELMETLAGHMAVALENARLYGRVRQERDAVELLYEVGQEMSAATDIEEVLPRVLALVVEKTGAYRGSVIVLDSMGNPHHHVLVREDLSPTVLRLLVLEILRRGLAGWVAEHRQPALVADTAQDPRWLELPETLKGVRSAMAVPLLRHDTLVGVLTLVHRVPGYFQESHLQLVTSVANQAAIAIDNARLLMEAQRRVAQLNAILEINQSLSSDMPIRDLLEMVTFSAHGLLDASNTVLYLLDEAGQRLLPSVALGADSVILREHTLEVGEGLTGLAVQTRRAYILNEAHLSSLAKHLEGTPLEPEALLAVPLMQGDRAVGALTVSRYGEGVQFGPADREMAELLASQAVVVLNNARLYDQVRRRADDMASLNRIARTVGSTLDLDEVLRQVIQELNRSFHVEAGSILLVDRARNDLYFATTLEGGMERFLDVRIPMGVGIVGCVAQSGQAEIVNDPASDPRFYKKISSDVGFVNRNILCVPLLSRDRVIGVIELLNKEGGCLLYTSPSPRDS